MGKKKKQIPVPDPEKTGPELYICPSASFGDMTGLIPKTDDGPSERRAYRDMYAYMADAEQNRDA